MLRTKLIKMHSRRPRDTGAALALYDEMQRDGIAPDLVTYNTCLAAAGEEARYHAHAARVGYSAAHRTDMRPAVRAGLGHHWPRVLLLLEDMEREGAAWDGFTLSALLTACQACGRWEQALEWFRRAQEARGEGSCLPTQQ